MPAISKDIASLQAKIWSGSLALEIKLAASDCRRYDESEPYLVQCPRLSYLAFLLPRLHRYFGPDLIDPDVPFHDAWLSFEDVPLKWHYPVGLLYDLLSGAHPVALEPPSLSGKGLPLAASQLPVPEPVEPEELQSITWRLTIHYSEFPTEQLLQLDAEGRTMHDTYINTVKEADFVRNGTARTVMSLSKSDSDNLWLAVQDRM